MAPALLLAVATAVSADSGTEFVDRLQTVCKMAAGDRSLAIRLGCAEVAADPESAASLAANLRVESCRVLNSHCSGGRGRPASGVDADGLADRLGCDPEATPRCSRRAVAGETEFDLCGGRLRIEGFRDVSVRGEPNWIVTLAWKDGSRLTTTEHFLPVPDTQAVQRWMRHNSRQGSSEAASRQLVSESVRSNCAEIEGLLRRTERERGIAVRITDALIQWLIRDLQPHCGGRMDCFKGNAILPDGGARS